MLTRHLFLPRPPAAHGGLPRRPERRSLARGLPPALCCAAALALCAALCAEAAADTERVPSLEQQVVERVNAYRREQGLEPLQAEPDIAATALAHSRDMAARGKLSHQGFEGRVEALRDRLALRAAAENVAMNEGYENPAEQTVTGWIESAGHRRNLVGDYGRTGVGAVRDAGGAVWVTQIYVRTR
jgi:uncharacterized protein YkwD